VSYASFRCLARRLRPSFSLFLLSLAYFWPSDFQLYLRSSGDMFDSDLSEDLTSGAVGGIGSGRRIIKASQPGTRLALL
jgi:hypothetical protein